MLPSGGRAIVPGSADTSLVLERIVSTDPDLQMPPEGPRLTPAQVASLRDWIGEGAAWKEHWAFRAPSRPPVPAIEPPLPDAFAPEPVFDSLAEVPCAQPPARRMGTPQARAACWTLASVERRLEKNISLF